MESGDIIDSILINSFEYSSFDCDNITLFK